MNKLINYSRLFDARLHQTTKEELQKRQRKVTV